MFQNIAEDAKQEEYEDVKEVNKKLYIKRLFSIPNIILYAISFMLSMVSFGTELAPFGLAIFVATCSNKIPSGIVFVAVGIGTLIKFGPSGLLMYILTVLVFMALVLIFRPKYEYAERNEKQKLGKYILIAILLVQVAKMFFTMFLVYNLLTAIMLSITTYIFYKIFSNSIIVVKEFGVKQAFSIEEVMGAALMLSIAFSSLKGLTVFSLSITNILSIMLILFLGWKHGMLVGGTAGITIGMVLGIITSSSPILVAAYAISRNDCRNIKQIRTNRSNHRILLGKCTYYIFYKW